MQVYRNVLVAMDCSPVDDAVLTHVSALAKQNDADVVLLHVVHSHTLDQERVLRETAETALASACRRLRAEGVRATPLLRSGEPEEEILAETTENKYDLLAMATHGHTFWGDLLLGSVSDSLKHRLSLPLLLVRGDPTARWSEASPEGAEDDAEPAT